MDAEIRISSPSKRSKKSHIYPEDDTQLLKTHCFLQSHDSDNDPGNFSVQIWSCKFQPESTDIVATCGGDTVCIIDVNTAKVLSKFFKQGEEFYTLDWAQIHCKKFTSNILACGGCFGTVYLIHAEQFCVYGFFRAHTKPVQELCFVPGNPNLLLTAGNERKICLWDIGELSLPDYHFSYKKLATFSGLHYSPLKMLVYQEDYLFCATEGGLFCWYVKDGFVSGKSIRTHSNPSEAKFLFVAEEPCVDGLEIVDDDLIATKCAQSGVIFLWKPSNALREIQQGKSSFKANVVDELKWSNTDQLYLNITTAGRYLFAGDDKGRIWIYDCNNKGSKRDSKKLKPYIPGKPRPALQILDWPVCERDDKIPIESLANGPMINNITCGKDLQYLVAAGNNNLICIYKIAL